MIINIKRFSKIIHTKIQLKESIITKQTSWSHHLLSQKIISVVTVVISKSGAEPFASQLDKQVRSCVSFLSKNFGKLLENIEKNIRSNETIRKHVKKPKENQIKKVIRQAEQYLSGKKKR